MIAKILISIDLDKRKAEINKIVGEFGLEPDHPDLLYIDDDEKLGVEGAKKVRDHLSLKPFSAKGRAVVIVSGHNLTNEAQNSLLKILEEPPLESLIVIGVENEEQLLETIRSRCEIIFLVQDKKEVHFDRVEKIMGMNLDQRFEFVEKLDEKEELVAELIEYYHQKVMSEKKLEKNDLEFAKKLIEAEKWSKAHVNIRAIVEYLMLTLPNK